MNWTFFSMTRRIEFFLSMSQKNRAILLLEYDSKNSLFCKYDSKNWFFLWLTKSNHLFEDDSKNRTHFLNATSKIELLFKNTKSDFFLKNSKKSNHFQKNMTQRIDFFVFFFPKMTQIFEFFSYDSKNWTPCYEPLFNMTQRDEVLFFQYDSKIFSNMTRRIEPFFITWLKDLVSFHQKKNSKNLTSYDSQTWTFFSKYFSLKNDSKNWSPFSLWLSKCFFFFEIRIRLTELIFFQYDSQNWFFWIWLFWDIELFFNTTQRIEILQYNSEDSTFFLWYDSKYWTFFSFNLTQRIEPFFSIGFKGLNSFIEYDSKNLTFFELDPKGWTFLLSMTQRIEPFFFWNMTQTITFGKGSKIVFNDPQNWTNEKQELKELNLFFWVWYKEWNLFLSMIQRIELFFEYDSKNETIF